MKNISNFKILNEIGSGGMGTVYFAKHTKTGEKVAIKIIHPELSSNDEFRTRFMEEGELLSRFNHPHIVKYIEDGEFNDNLYIVTELLEGESLKDFFDSNESLIPVEKIRKVLIESSLALGFAHFNGVIHRDIKPGNIYFHSSENGITTKVLDFGIAKFKDQASKTATHIALGTPQYVPPEVLKGEAVSPASDIYSLGVVAYRLLTGKMPIDLPEDQANIVATTLAIYNAHQNGIPKILDINADADIELAEVVDRMLKTNPKERFQNGSELFEILTKNEDPDKTSFAIPVISQCEAEKSVLVPKRYYKVDRNKEKKNKNHKCEKPKIY